MCLNGIDFVQSHNKTVYDEMIFYSMILILFKVWGDSLNLIYE